MWIITAKGRLGPMTGAPGQPPDYPLRSRAQGCKRLRRFGKVAPEYGRLDALIVALVQGRVQQKSGWMSANTHLPVAPPASPHHGISSSRSGSASGSGGAVGAAF